MDRAGLPIFLFAEGGADKGLEDYTQKASLSKHEQTIAWDWVQGLRSCFQVQSGLSQRGSHSNFSISLGGYDVGRLYHSIRCLTLPTTSNKLRSFSEVQAESLWQTA